MKRTLSQTISICMMAIMIWSCQTDSKKRIVYLYPSIDRARFVKEGNFMMERLKELGADAKMVDADDNEALQITKGMQLIDKGVDLMIVTAVNGSTIAPLIRYANEKGVPIVAFNRLISNTQYDLFVTGDNTSYAEIFCDIALQQHPTGNYVILAGDRFDRNGIELKNAIDSILKPQVDAGNINIVYESFIDQWSKENSAMEMEQVLQSWGKNIDVVISCSDPMAKGAIEMLQKYKVEHPVVVTGQDAEIEAVKDIIKGLQTVTIYHPHKILGYKTAEVAMDILNGKQIKNIANSQSFNGAGYIPTLQIKSVAITKDNYEKELIETGEYTASDLY